MKLKEITPYLIIGAVIAVIAFFVMPWVHTLRWPNATYAEGLSFANAMIALVIDSYQHIAFTEITAERKRLQKMILNHVLQLVNQVLTFLGLMGVIVDLTTAGLGDSDRAMRYEDPWDDNVNK